MGLGLFDGGRGSRCNGLVDEEVDDLVAFGKVAGFDKDRIGRYR
jgi:hypothetical protein